VSEDNDIIKHYNSQVPEHENVETSFKGGYKYVSYTEVSLSPRIKKNTKYRLAFKKSTMQGDEEA
jgi:hypothetical protein